MTDTPDPELTEAQAETDAVLRIVDVAVRGILHARAGDDIAANAEAEAIADHLDSLADRDLRIMLLAAVRIITTDVLDDLAAEALRGAE
jgi:hypothetical protein